jgi:hypothetical protein
VLSLGVSGMGLGVESGCLGLGLGLGVESGCNIPHCLTRWWLQRG